MHRRVEWPTDENSSFACLPPCPRCRHAPQAFAAGTRGVAHPRQPPCRRQECSSSRALGADVRRTQRVCLSFVLSAWRRPNSVRARAVGRCLWRDWSRTRSTATRRLVQLRRNADGSEIIHWRLVVSTVENLTIYVAPIINSVMFHSNFRLGECTEPSVTSNSLDVLSRVLYKMRFLVRSRSRRSSLPPPLCMDCSCAPRTTRRRFLPPPRSLLSTHPPPHHDVLLVPPP